MTQSYEGKCAVCGLRVIDAFEPEGRHAPIWPWRCPACGHTWQSKGKFHDYMNKAMTWDVCPVCGERAVEDHAPVMVQQEGLL